MLARVNLCKAAFAYFRTDYELTNNIIARLRPTRGRAGSCALVGHDVLYWLAVTGI